MIQNILFRIRRDQNLKYLLKHSGIMYASGLVSTFLLLVQEISTASKVVPETYGGFAAIVGIGALIMLIIDVRTWEQKC